MTDKLQISAVSGDSCCRSNSAAHLGKKPPHADDAATYSCQDFTDCSCFRMLLQKCCTLQTHIVLNCVSINQFTEY